MISLTFLSLIYSISAKQCDLTKANPVYELAEVGLQRDQYEYHLIDYFGIDPQMLLSEVLETRKYKAKICLAYQVGICELLSGDCVKRLKQMVELSSAMHFNYADVAFEVTEVFAIKDLENTGWEYNIDDLHKKKSFYKNKKLDCAAVVYLKKGTMMAMGDVPMYVSSSSRVGSALFDNWCTAKSARFVNVLVEHQLYPSNPPFKIKEPLKDGSVVKPINMAKGCSNCRRITPRDTFYDLNRDKEEKHAKSRQKLHSKRLLKAGPLTPTIYFQKNNSNTSKDKRNLQVSDKDGVTFVYPGHNMAWVIDIFKTGQILTHEIGHLLGLSHHNRDQLERPNVMQAGVVDDLRYLTQFVSKDKHHICKRIFQGNCLITNT